MKDKLRRRAKRNGRSVEEEVREILRDATKREGKRSRLLGTEIAQLFRRAGLKPGEEIRELREIEIEPQNSRNDRPRYKRDLRPDADGAGKTRREVAGRQPRRPSGPQRSR